MAPTAQPGVAPTAGRGAAGDIVQQFVDDVTSQFANTVRPAAVAAVAQAFTFPLILMLAVLLFLLGQSRMDDQKFRMAPLDRAETTVRFEEELA